MRCLIFSSNIAHPVSKTMNTVSHNKTSVSTMKKIRFLDQQESIRGKLNFSDESQDGRG